MKVIHFLGHGNSETNLIKKLEKRNCKVIHTNEKISLNCIEGSDLIVSFGYRHIFKSQFINNCKCPIVNLHISYLPFNKGAHPNFWSFHDGTPSGVSIHLIDEGIDTGPILFQKKVKFTDEKTFTQTYKRLFYEIENLFIANIDSILNKNWIEKRQVGEGTFHFTKDLPNSFSGWNSNTVDEINRIKMMNNIVVFND